MLDSRPVNSEISKNGLAQNSLGGNRDYNPVHCMLIYSKEKD